MKITIIIIILRVRGGSNGSSVAIGFRFGNWLPFRCGKEGSCFKLDESDRIMAQSGSRDEDPKMWIPIWIELAKSVGKVDRLAPFHRPKIGSVQIHLYVLIISFIFTAMS